MSGEPCTFCEIARGDIAVSLIEETALTMTFVDLRQWHSGHVLVISRAHLNDIRDADEATAAAVMQAVARVSRAVSAVFPNDGISLWHSAGPGAHQEVPHLHVHVHPRLIGDEILRVYPVSPPTPSRDTLERHAQRLREVLAST